ncbi:hypothetical protein I204_00995 [Kwoniella mangroviensis CBS 8886]|uniref:uncharacterized protein n=1 Tax=Kwoniella mangroviensis CBS 8507 TaxID=1296122 RepID=UPI00080D65A9|nr:uncharacterized protein I203_08083 [Kwoniella mangroviensis CBS 8507]OCF62859.1 hypothetical protein I203_08083 [Kwoniella mangroviensis CBS 8507]OCF79051.1 hypothetical protein I204_00995 [Kwoniella mangroviensis CBS 8886]
MAWSIFTNPFGASSSSSASSSTQHIEAETHADVLPAPTLTPPAPQVNKYETVLQDEEKYQEVQYPTTEHVPGCMTLLDEFLMCYALAPQLRSMYRYGEFRDCTWKWEDFKYCLSLKSDDEEMRRKLWIKRRAEWWAKRRVDGSSEDVWDVRSEPPKNFPPLVTEEITSESSTT